MLVGYAGKVINGKPTLTEKISLPENAEIIIMIELTTKNENLTGQQAAAQKFLTAMQNLRKKGFTIEDEEALAAFQR